MTDTPSHDLVVRPSQSEIIRPLDPQSVVQAMSQHQELVRAILDDTDWQGRPDAPGSFVKKSGWRKIAAGYSLSLGRVHEEVERGPHPETGRDGFPLRASYTAYAQAPNGRRVEATGHCSYEESRFSGPRGNTSKLENDMRATAETRAKNRAISDLIGMGKVSAEEAAAGTPEAGPPWGPVVNTATDAKLPAAVATILGLEGEEARARAVPYLEAVWRRFDYMPAAVAQALLMLAVDVRDGGQPTPAEGTDAPAADTPAAEGPAPGEGEPIVDAEVVPEQPAPEAEPHQPIPPLDNPPRQSLEEKAAQMRAELEARGVTPDEGDQTSPDLGDTSADDEIPY